MKFVIRFSGSTDYYSGKTYILHGDRFPCYCTLDKAKVYTSKKRAENAAEAIGGNGGTPIIEEIVVGGETE